MADEARIDPGGADAGGGGGAVPAAEAAGGAPAEAGAGSAGAEGAGNGGVEDAQPFQLPDFAALVPDASGQVGIDLLADVNLHVKIELGRTRMLLEDVLRLGEGAVVELDRLAGDPVDIFVNDRLLARGEILVVNDAFCVRVSEVLDAGAAADEAA